MIGKMQGMMHVCKSNCLSILKVKVIVVFFSIRLTDKADDQDPKRRENYWMRTLKTYAHLDLILKTVSNQSHAEI